uniref:Uncharacterized protein n=1 Tax=Arundo donax TaxID=35708 RepID=A0A0A9DJV2_ARUDO
MDLRKSGWGGSGTKSAHFRPTPVKMYIYSRNPSCSFSLSFSPIPGGAPLSASRLLSLPSAHSPWPPAPSPFIALHRIRCPHGRRSLPTRRPALHFLSWWPPCPAPSALLTAGSRRGEELVEQVVTLGGLALEALDVGPQRGGLGLSLGEACVEGGGLIPTGSGAREEAARAQLAELILGDEEVREPEAATT